MCDFLITYEPLRPKQVWVPSEGVGFGRVALSAEKIRVRNT